MNITQILRDRRAALGISQAELAAHCGFSHKSSVSLLESEQREWKFETVLKACELLGLEIGIKELE